jgi:hypothetical protein
MRRYLTLSERSGTNFYTGGSTRTQSAMIPGKAKQLGRTCLLTPSAAGLLSVLAILCLTVMRAPAEATRDQTLFLARASSISADEMAMLLATLIIAESSCGLEITDVPLNVAMRRYGYNVVDFLPDGRYAAIVELKARKAREFIQGTGKQFGCQGLIETVQRSLPEIVRK